MDKQTIYLITLIIAITGSNAWSHTSHHGSGITKTRIFHVD